MLKKIKFILFSGLMIVGICPVVNAQDVATDFFIEEPMVENVVEMQTDEVDSNDEMADEISVDALENYDMSGSLFERITLLEQDKVVLQLEKERAQLDLELERLNAEKMKLQMELDTLSGRAEHQQQELEVAKAQLEAQAEKLKQQKEALTQPEQRVAPQESFSMPKHNTGTESVNSKYKLVNIVGMGNQLQATLEEISTGQNKRISVGKQLDGYTVKSISLNDGIVFEKDGVTENINIGK